MPPLHEILEYGSLICHYYDLTESLTVLLRRLFKEHLGSFYQPALDDDLTKCFDQFKLVSGLNHKSLQKNGLIIGRPVAMTPQENYKFILSKVFYPTKISKFMMKMGLETDDVTQLAVDAVDNVVSYVKSKL
jgi:hypothetical protein